VAAGALALVFEAVSLEVIAMVAAVVTVAVLLV
jgi:hypothetical protein